jgi:hypothetical protein
MSLFETIIGIAERTWREKPRRDVAQAIVRLRRNMVKCQSSYDCYKQMLKYLGDEEPKEYMDRDLFTAHNRWGHAVEELAEDLISVSPLFEIFTPDVAKAVTTYLINEDQRTEILDFTSAAQRFGQRSDIDLENDRLDATFKIALDELDSFIRANLKLEEVFKHDE